MAYQMIIPKMNDGSPADIVCDDDASFNTFKASTLASQVSVGSTAEVLTDPLKAYMKNASGNWVLMN